MQYVSWYYNCAGSESSLLSCPYYTYYNSYNGRTAGVKCYSKRIYRHTCTCIFLLDSTNCSHGDIKLAGGKSSNEGDLQICVNGTWGYICSWNWYYWYNVYSNVNVVCRQFGYTAPQLQCKILLINAILDYIT